MMILKPPINEDYNIDREILLTSVVSINCCGRQVGNGQGLGTTFTGGLQLDGQSDSGIGGFVAGGVNNGDANGISPGLQTGFGFSGQGGQTVATAQLGGNVQAPQLGGVQFNR